MGTHVYDYIQGVDEKLAWTNPQNAFDQIDDTYASRTSPTGAAPDDNPLRGTLHNAPATQPEIGSIAKVELGLEAYVTNPLLSIQLQGVVGEVYGIWWGVDFPTADDDRTRWKDITDDPYLEPIFPWTWDDIKNLDLRARNWNADHKNPQTSWIDQFRLRVTIIGLQYSDGLVSVRVGG